MIFKKIYTFLNNYFNGNKISKAFSTLIFTLIFSSILFCSAYLGKASARSYGVQPELSVEELFAPFFNEDDSAKKELEKERLNAQNQDTQANRVSEAGVKYKKDGLGDKINEHYILYEKAGLQPDKIYTSYLPPKDSYNKNTATEHTLNACGNIGTSGLKMIGRDCMITIPFDCDTTSLGNFPAGILASEGVNCLNYSKVFDQGLINEKKLRPHKCDSTKTHGFTCLSTEKNYCHVTNKPILGINCRLAPCNSIPNEEYRRPGVNCLADCNNTTTDNISQPKFFMEGFNCLSSCRTFVSSPTEPTKIIGQNCVLEFNENVMPLCTAHPEGSTKHFNETTRKNKREDCLNLADLPLFFSEVEGQLELINSVKECKSVTATIPRPNINCINFDTTSKECHRYGEIQSLEANAQGNIICKKIDCHKLSDTELKRSFNTFSIENNRSTEKYCTPSLYTKFNFVQAMAINSRDSRTNPRYLADYLLAIKPCYGRGDTEEIEAILSSDYYHSSPNNKIDYLKTQASNSRYFPGRNDNEGLYDLSKACPLDNVSQVIACVNYLASKNNNNGIAQRPYDCNASSYCAECPQSLEICAKDTDKICYKNGINCNNPVNSPYAVCKEQTLPASKTDNKDEYVSWFFRPTLPAETFKENQDKSYSLISMSGYPMENNYSSTGGDDIYMSKKQVETNGFGNITQPWDVLWSSRTITPPSIGDSVGVPGVGAGYICGMNNDYRGIPSDDAVYFKGEVRTAYEADSKASHEVDVCIRYAASGTLPWESCGYRKCKTSCAFGACTKICGIDVCRPLKIIENSSQNCNSINTGDTDCTKTYETKLDAVSAETRVRIYKPDSSNYICAVLEFRGITTDMARRPFLNGTEHFEVPDPNDATKTKKICVSGGSYIDSSNSCKGVNSNDNDAITTGWRTSKIVRYIMEPPHPYSDLTGRGPAELPSKHIDMRTGATVNQTIGRVKFNIKRYFEKSDCIRHQERVAGPVFFAIAIPSNSERLFLPSVKIEKKCRIAITKVAGVTTGTECDPVDETDFFKPAITISYGYLLSNSILSDDLTTHNTNHKIIKIEDPNLSISGDYKIKAANIGIASTDPIIQTVFIKKEFSGLQPRLCLYKKIISPGNAAQYKTQVIECVNRRRATRAMIYPPSAPTHTTRQFEVGFLKDETILHSSITSDLLNQTFVFDDMTDKINNNDNLIKCLEIPSQGFPICIKREKCSLLNNECVENEKQLITLNNASTLDYAAIKQRQLVSNYCKKDLLVECNLRKGYELTAENQTLNTSVGVGKGFNASANDNYHGWFNEFCIESGIAKLDDTNTDEKIYVQRNDAKNDQLGSCKKDPNCSTSPLTATCISNGTCLRTSCCKIVKITDPLSSLATSHELNLCFEITDYLKSCPAISFGRNTNMSDPYFIGESFLSLDPAHSSHVGRGDSKIEHGTLSYDSHHAEYEVSYSGSIGVKGECNGFYTYANKDNFPTADCTADGTWKNFSKGFCAMYFCPAKKLEGVTGANQVGQYPSSYDSTNSPEGSKRGLFEGYANWDRLQKETLLKESATATSCIVGYAKKGATNGVGQISLTETTNEATLNSLNTYKSSSDEKGKVINALFGKYTGFSGGTSPTRYCNQRGIWESVTDACERITCPAISFDQPVEAGAFYMNDYKLKVEALDGKNTIYTEKSPYAHPASPIKAKFIIERNINSPVYLSAVNTSHSINGFLIKMKSGSSTEPASIEEKKTYVVKLIAPASGDKYWEIMDNANDNVLIMLWQKSKGASFPAGYAIRSTSFNYTYNDSGSDEKDMHKVSGVCNIAMGFRSLLDEYKPQFTCDSKGNWIDLINPCVSDCGAISEDVGRNAIHGFAMWDKASTQVGFFDTVASTGCVNGFFKYPYEALFDNEGSKKDFGIGEASENEFITSNSYHAIANTYDGASFRAEAGAGENLNPRTMNSEGRAYNLKINTSNPQSQSVASSSSQEAVKTLFHLFNTAPLAMNAPDQTVWSKIKFSSFGAPLYHSDENIVETACHLPYSKLILANKCIGKKTCSIELSDFTSYNGTPCANTNLGFGLDGEQNVTEKSYGSGGGGGGGNNPGNGGSSVSNINGTSGNSFYDKSFHVIAPTLSDAENKGLKVNLKVPDTDDNLKAKFKGKDGSVKIIESTTEDFRSIEKTADYTSHGEQTHTVTTVPPAGQDFIYIKYEMSGAGGGGGGQGLTPGTDGASGTKMTGGVFKVKSGTTLKIYVGGGGGAGKTKCAPAPVSFLDPNIIQPAIEIIEPTKKTNLAIKILNKIGSLFISEGWAQEKKCSATGKGYKASGLAQTATGATGTINCGGTSYPSYNGSVKYTCSPTGVVNVAGSCGCVAGYLKNDNGDCEISCSYAAGNGYAASDARIGATGLIDCSGEGYLVYKKAAYTCTASTTGSTFTLKSGCSCLQGYAKTTTLGAACSRITCFASGGKGYGKQAVEYSSSGATITCGGASYPAYSSTNAIYTCTGPTTSDNPGTFALVTPCACATGYNRDSSGNCVSSICQVSSEYNIEGGTVNAATTATSVACKEGYYGTPTYTCIMGNYVQTGTCARIQCTAPRGSNSNLIDGSSLDFTSGTKSVNLTCNLGYVSSLGTTRPSYTCKDGIGTVGAYRQNGTCNPISCTISPGDGYAGRTLSGKDKFPCDTGYYGDINYTCGANNAVTLTGSCSRVRCNLPEGANSDIVPLANSSPPYREVFYSPASKPLKYRCATGYQKTYSQTTLSYVDPTYTCVTDNSIAEYQNPCEIVRCYSYGQKIYDYNGGTAQEENCDTNSGYWDTSKFICNLDGTLKWVRSCKSIKCSIPIDKNTTLDMVGFSADASGLDCKAGYYYENASTRPRYTCTYSDNAQLEYRGILNFQGSCQRITCRIPASGSQFSLNSNIDGTSVDWTGSEYKTTTCKNGFYQVDPLKLPSYSCLGGSKIGELRTLNPCAPVTCDLPDRFGMLAKTNLEYGVNKTTSCDKPGYSGIVTYTCANPVTTAGKGAVTGVSSTCTESSCVATGNTLATFNTYVIQAGVSSLGAGGAGGKISNAIEFLKGGNGGSATGSITPVDSSTPISYTSGSGGGGGAASMIAINQRIIAIAGGGGGGGGGGVGGADVDLSDANTKYNNIDNLDIILKSNVFGPYFIGEMQYSKINVSEAKTTGILYGHTTSPKPFSLDTIPPGTYINEILFASHGNPVLPKTSLDPLIWKYGNCNDPNSLSKSINQCGGKTFCSIDVNAEFTYCHLPTKEFGLVASYYYKEPTLQVASSAGLPAYRIKEKSGNQVDLKDGEVYTFVLGEEGNTPFWFKYPYLSDEYMISSPIPAPLPPNTKTKIRIKFHRTNSTFYPTLKTNLSSWPLPIFKSYGPGKTTSLSVNYIKTSISYILTLENNYWIIREFTSGKVDGGLLEKERFLPKRSCTTNKISSTGDALNVAWSLPSSSCVNYCPGYDPVTKIGDDRINVGATEHLTSTSQGAKGIVYWRNGEIGQSSVMKFSNIINNGVFPEYTNIVSASDFRINRSRSYFALSRYCGRDGVWSNPIPLCAFTKSDPKDDSGIPVAGGTSYIYFNQQQDLLTDSGNKYLRVNSNSDIALSACKDLHFPQTDNGSGYSIPNNYNSKIYDPPKYKCVSPASNFVDQTYFEEVPDTVNTMPCVQYCDVKRIPQNTISYSGQDDYKVRIKNSSLPSGLKATGLITLECAPGFAYKLVSSGTKLVRSDIKPKVECLLQNGAAGWGQILDNCDEGRPCTFRWDKKEFYNLGKAYNDSIFLIWPFIAEIHRSGGAMNHDETYTHDILPPDYINHNDEHESYKYKINPQKNGKCGYCKRVRKNEAIFDYYRKYLRSYSCKDGEVSYVWDKQIDYTDDQSGYNTSPDNRDGDPDIGAACDHDPWDNMAQGGENHPKSAFLGYCTKEKPGDNVWNDLFNNWQPE